MLEIPPTIVGIDHIQMEAPPGSEEAAQKLYAGILLAAVYGSPVGLKNVPSKATLELE